MCWWMFQPSLAWSFCSPSSCWQIFQPNPANGTHSVLTLVCDSGAMTWPAPSPSIVLLSGSICLAGELPKFPCHTHSQPWILCLLASATAMFDMLSHGICMCQQVLQPGSVRPPPSRCSQECQLSFAVSLGSVHHHPHLSCKLAEAVVLKW